MEGKNIYLSVFPELLELLSFCLLKLTLISKGFLKQLTIKTNGKNSRRFDRSSVIIKRNVENMNLHRYIK